MTYYQILQWTPSPNRFENIPEWQLQAAEYDLKLNKTHYYEHAVKKGNSILYPLEIAKRIVAYWENRWEFADYQLVEVEPLSVQMDGAVCTCVLGDGPTANPSGICGICGKPRRQ